MSAYAVFVVDRETNAEMMKQYRSGGVPTLAKVGAQVLTRPGNFLATLEGDAIETLVIIEFPSLQIAQDWYHSEEYQKAAGFRKAGSVGRAFIVEGN